MPVTINIPEGSIAEKITGAWDKLLPHLTEEILNDCNQYCKEDTGTLIASSLVHSIPAQGLMKWVTPYARRQYWEIRTAHKDVNPKASWRWCEVAKQAHLERWGRQAQAYMEKYL